MGMVSLWKWHVQEPTPRGLLGWAGCGLSCAGTEEPGTASSLGNLFLYCKIDRLSSQGDVTVIATQGRDESFQPTCPHLPGPVPCKNWERRGTRQSLISPSSQLRDSQPECDVGRCREASEVRGHREGFFGRARPRLR